MSTALTSLGLVICTFILVGIVYLFAAIVTVVQHNYGLPYAMALFVAVVGGSMWGLFGWLLSRANR